MRVIKLIFAALLISSCGQSTEEDLQEENDELRSRILQLEEHVGALESGIQEARVKADAVQAASDQLQTETSRFQYEDWQDVVGDVQSAGEAVDQSADEMDVTISDIESQL